jgi:thioredoxin 1
MPLKTLVSAVLIIMLSFATLLSSGCGASGDNPPIADSSAGSTGGPDIVSGPPTGQSAEPEPVVITAVDLDHLLSQGLPLILNFGDDSQGSRDTLAALEKIYGDYHRHILIRSVDVARHPEAREGFPNLGLSTSQFFYTADGEPIALPMDIGILMSMFLCIDTEEALFTMHEGPLSENELMIILAYMGVPIFR